MRITDSKQIKKGDRVIKLDKEQKRGTFHATRWIVAAAGKKQILLNREDGTMMGYRLWASYLDLDNAFFRLFAANTEQEVVVESASAWNDIEIAGIKKTIATNQGAEWAGYRSHLEGELMDHSNLQVNFEE